MKLFTTYRRKDWPFVVLFTAELKKVRNYSIFIDYIGIDDTYFDNSLLLHLRESDAVMVVVTENTFAPERIFHDDDWVRREIAVALNLEIPIVLILVDNRLPPLARDLPEDIRAVGRLQGIAFYQDFLEAATHKLADFIDKAAGGQGGLVDHSWAALKSHYAEIEKVLEMLNSGDFSSASASLEDLLRQADSNNLLQDPVSSDLRELICRKLQASSLEFLNESRLESALRTYQLLMELDSEHADKYLTQIGSYYLENKNYRLAHKAYNEALAVNPANWEALLGRSELECVVNSDFTLALFLLQTAVELNPQQSELWTQKGVVLLRAGRPEDALLAFDRALNLVPNNPLLLENKKVALERLGRIEEAKRVRELLRVVFRKRVD